MLATRLVSQLQDPASATGALPGLLHRRAISRAIKDVLFPSDKPIKPAWWHIEAIVEKAGWPRQTRSSSGYPWPKETIPEGHHPFICATGLIDAVEATCGYLSDDSVLWTVAKEVFGHSIVVSDHLERRIQEELAKGHPFYAYDRDRLEPMPPQREAEAFWTEIQRLLKQGTLTSLTPEDMADPNKVRVVCWMRCVFKGSPPLSPEEAMAVNTNDIVAIAAIAQQREEEEEEEEDIDWEEDAFWDDDEEGPQDIRGRGEGGKTTRKLAVMDCGVYTAARLGADVALKALSRAATSFGLSMTEVEDPREREGVRKPHPFAFSALTLQDILSRPMPAFGEKAHE
jgi:hypothetical protein